MSDHFIDYSKLIDDAMHVIVKQALSYVKQGGLPGKHHFFISFLTSHTGVSISKALKEKYPHEMTIVLQHQFEHLKVADDYFSVVLSFDNVKENIKIPFDALIAFADPSVKFGLQFSHLDSKDSEEQFPPTESGDITPEGIPKKKASPPAKKGKNSKDVTPVAANNVVDIDTFRKK